MSKLQPTERFSDRVENYVKFRPSYPDEVLHFLRTNLGLNTTSVIVDVGSGTGISSLLFLKNGNVVHGIEPNEQMRNAAEEALKEFPHFQSHEGTAERTGLPDHIADFVVAAQAFHWFDASSAKAEFSRILKDSGRIVLIWNERRTTGTPFAVEYEALLEEFGTDYQQVQHKNVDGDRIRSVIGPFQVEQFSNHQDFDFDGLLGRLASSSYAPNVGHPRFMEMRTRLQQLFEKHQQNGLVRIEYDTKVYYSKSL